jgi:hypothetical protein
MKFRQFVVRPSTGWPRLGAYVTHSEEKCLFVRLFVCVCVCVCVRARARVCACVCVIMEWWMTALFWRGSLMNACLCPPYSLLHPPSLPPSSNRRHSRALSSLDTARYGVVDPNNYTLVREKPSPKPDCERKYLPAGGKAHIPEAPPPAKNDLSGNRHCVVLFLWLCCSLSIAIVFFTFYDCVL